MIAYPVARKQKSIDICKAWLAGCGGGELATQYKGGPCVFYGVDQSNYAIWQQVCRSGDEFWYADNAYFDTARQAFFRVTKNALQHSGIGQSDGERFRALKLSISPWRTAGAHIVLCEQSEPFMRMVVGATVNWKVQTLDALESLTRRPIRMREWSPDKAKLARSLPDDLAGAHALVTWSSAAAVTAVLAGVPIVTMGQCAAEPMAGSLMDIESLPRLERENWAGVLADNQWTLAEMASGFAWRSLNG